MRSTTKSYSQYNHIDNIERNIRRLQREALHSTNLSNTTEPSSNFENITSNINNTTELSSNSENTITLNDNNTTEPSSNYEKLLLQITIIQ